MQKPNPGGDKASSDPVASGGAPFALSSPAASRSAFDRAWFGPALIAASAAVMLAWTWNTWADPWVDFGQQLYLAWRISAGDVLYRDIAYHHGPLSAYFNAALFRVLGVGLPVILAANLAGLAVLLTLLYRLLARLADRPTATIAGLVLVFVFAFGHLGATQGYNYLAPYVHESTHGLILAVAALSAFAKYVIAAIRTHHVSGGMMSPEVPPLPAATSPRPAVRTPAPIPANLWLVLAGLLAGLTFLTKAEPFLAIAAALAVGCVATGWTLRVRIREVAARLGLLAAAIAVPPILTFALFAAAMPPRDALFAALGPWPSVLSSQAGGLLAYRAELGLTDPSGNLHKMLLWAAGYAAIVALALGAAWAMRAAKHRHPLVTAGCFTLVCAFCALLPARSLFESARPLPLFMLAVAVACAAALRRIRNLPDGSCSGARREPQPSASGRRRPARLHPAPTAASAAAPHILTLTWAAFALVMLAKMLLAARLFHYGFTLALPAQLLLVVALFHRLPALAESLNIPGGGLRGAALAFFAALCVTHVAWSRHFSSQKTATIASGPDTLRARPADADLMNRLLAEIAARSRPADTLVTLPDGMMVNFLARRAGSIPYMYFMPADLLIYGEDHMAAALHDHPPDFIVLIHKDTSEFGYQFFGRDYGRALMMWIMENYATTAQIGEFPLRDAGRNGVALLKRRR